jgi:hypothetical protein
VSFTLSVSSSNALFLTFSPAVSLSLADLKVVIDGVTDFTLILEQSSTTGWKITIVTSQAISDGAQVTVSITDLAVAGGAQFINDSASGSLSSQSAPLTSEEQQAAAIGATASAASTTAVSSTTAASFSTGSMSSAWGMINNIQMIGFIPMMDIDLPLGLKSFFVSVLTFNLVPNFFEYFEPDDSPKNIESACRVGKTSSLFMSNAGELFSTFFIMLLFWPVTCSLAKAKNHKVAGYFYDASSSYKWSFFIRFLIEGYLELTFAALFQLHSMTLSSFNLIANMCFAAAFMVISLVSPVVCVYFVYKNHHRFKDPEEKQFRKEFGSIFDEFKNDKGFLSCSFYFLFLLRRFLYVGIQYSLEAFPLVQVILNVLHSLASFAYLKTFVPFKEKYLNISNIYAELCITVTFALSGVFLLNLSNSTRFILMWTTLGVVYSMMLVNFIVTVILTAREAKKLVQKWRTRWQRRNMTRQTL